MAAHSQPQGKVRERGPARFEPLLIRDKSRVPLGNAHESLEAAYDEARRPPGISSGGGEYGRAPAIALLHCAADNLALLLSSPAAGAPDAARAPL